jgi:hypothetical protein
MSSEGRTETIRLRVTPAEKADIEESAGEQGVSEFVREAVALRTGKVAARPAPNPADADFIERRARQLEAEGLPRPNARILAARERSGHRIGNIFHPPGPYRPPDNKAAQLAAVRLAFARSAA